MSELLGITVADLVQTMKARRVRIPSEIGAFVALEVCEALVAGPAAVKLTDVRIAEDGTISVFAPPGSATSEEAARSVVSLLGALLVAAGTGVPRTLVTLLENGPSSGRWDLSSLRDDLEASLVPLNRGAARRVLSRMLREASKGRSRPPSRAPSAAPPPGDRSLDDQLDDLLGGLDENAAATKPASARPQSRPERGADSRAGADADADLDEGLDEDPDEGLDEDLDAELDATLDQLGAPGAPSEPPRAASAAPAAAGSEEPEPDDATIADEAPPFADAAPPAAREAAPERRGPRGDLDALAEQLEEPEKSNPIPWILAMLAIAAATAAALALMRPDLVDAVLGRPPPPPAPEGPTEADRERMLREHRARFGTLEVRAVPERAQVLLYVGRGPAVAEELPLGVAHEFVAIADGRRPSRAVLPADAEWEETEEGRRYELAMQAGDEPMAADALELGPTRLPQDVGSPSTTLGDVRVVTNPPGAKVYVLVGFSPTVTLQNVRTDEAVELLVYHEDHPLERVVVAPSDWEPATDGSKRASVSVVLEGAEE